MIRGAVRVQIIGMKRFRRAWVRDAINPGMRFLADRVGRDGGSIFNVGLACEIFVKRI